MSTQLLLVSIFKALAEVALFSLLGQGLLYVLAGSSRDRNVIYKLFQILTGPVIRVVRRVTPRFIIDRHVPVVAFFLVLWLWVLLIVGKGMLCQGNLSACV